MLQEVVRWARGQRRAVNRKQIDIKSLAAKEWPLPARLLSTVAAHVVFWQVVGTYVFRTIFGFSNVVALISDEVENKASLLAPAFVAAGVVSALLIEPLLRWSAWCVRSLMVMKKGRIQKDLSYGAYLTPLNFLFLHEVPVFSLLLGLFQFYTLDYGRRIESEEMVIIVNELAVRIVFLCLVPARLLAMAYYALKNCSLRMRSLSTVRSRQLELAANAERERVRKDKFPDRLQGDPKWRFAALWLWSAALCVTFDGVFDFLFKKSDAIQDLAETHMGWDIVITSLYVTALPTIWALLYATGYALYRSHKARHRTDVDRDSQDFRERFKEYFLSPPARLNIANTLYLDQAVLYYIGMCTAQIIKVVVEHKRPGSLPVFDAFMRHSVFNMMTLSKMGCAILWAIADRCCKRTADDAVPLLTK